VAFSFKFELYSRSNDSRFTIHSVKFLLLRRPRAD